MRGLKRAPELEKLLDAVHEIAPGLEACAGEAEKLRHLPQRAVDLMVDADLFRCASPREVGGLEADPVTQTEIFEAVAATESYAGWNLMIGAIWDGLLGGKLPDEGARAVFNGGGWPIMAGLVWPFGRAAATGDGQYSLKGHWKFASGIHQASWVASGCHVYDGDTPRQAPGGAPALFIAVVPKAMVAVDDNWDVSGLRGTGSCDYSIEDVTIGEGFIFSGLAPLGQRGGAWYRQPGPMLTSPGHTGFGLGVAKRCLEEVKAIGSRRRYLNPSSQAERETVQMELGRRMAEYEAVRLLAIDYFERSREFAEQGVPAPWKPVNTYATEVAVRCAEFAYRAMGGDAVFADRPVQRYLRDILAAQQHAAVGDNAYVRYGKEAFEAANQ